MHRREELMKAVILAASLFLLFSCSVASAQLNKMTVGYGSISAAQLPVWVAKEAGIFTKKGFDVQLGFFKSSTPPGNGLGARENPIRPVAGPPILDSRPPGARPGVCARR